MCVYLSISLNFPRLDHKLIVILAQGITKSPQKRQEPRQNNLNQKDQTGNRLECIKFSLQKKIIKLKRSEISQMQARIIALCMIFLHRNKV